MMTDADMRRAAAIEAMLPLAREWAAGFLPSSEPPTTLHGRLVEAIRAIPQEGNSNG